MDDVAADFHEAMDAIEAVEATAAQEASDQRAAALAGAPIYWRGQEIKPAGFERKGWAQRMGLQAISHEDGSAEDLFTSDIFACVNLLWVYLGPFDEVRASVFVPDPARKLNSINFQVFEDSAQAWARGLNLTTAEIIEGLYAIAVVEARNLAAEFDVIMDITGGGSGGNAPGQN